MFGSKLKSTMVAPADALRGRETTVLPHPRPHRVLGTPIVAPWPDGAQTLSLALGCFWGAEKAFWKIPGVITTAVGYQGGITPNPTYEEVCSGLTGHAETVLVVFDPTVVTATELLRAFWELHDPTQGFRQGNDVGTQYRSAVYWTTPEQGLAAQETRAAYTDALGRAGYGDITTELRPIEEAGPFYYAEDYHQQYLDQNPGGYCPIHSTGVECR